MCKTTKWCVCLILFTVTLGCGSSKEDASDQAKVTRAQSLIDDYVSAMNNSVAKLEAVVDEASAKSASEELSKSAKRFREIAKDIKSVGKLSKAEHAQLSMKGLQTASANFSKANKSLLSRIQDGSIPPEANKALQDSYLDFSKASMEISEAFKVIEP